MQWPFASREIFDSTVTRMTGARFYSLRLPVNYQWVKRQLFSPLCYSTVVPIVGGVNAVVWSILAATLDILAVRAVEGFR
jgi:hypothetical protein